MKSVLKKGVAVILAVLMAFTVPYFAYAESAYDFTIESSAVIHYSGIQYEFTATIKNVPQEYLVEKVSTTQSEFSWSVTEGASVTSNNNYSVTPNDDGTYTVSEKATVTMPAPTSNVNSVNVTAQYNNAEIGSASSGSIELLVPITSISATSDASTDVDSNLAEAQTPTRNNPAYNYYYQSSTSSGSSAFYINSASSSEVKKALDGEPVENDPLGYISYSVLPENNLDGIVTTLIGANSSYDYISYFGDNKIAVGVVDNKSAPSTFQIKLSPQSGYKHEKIIDVYVCTPMTEFKLVSGDVVVADTSSETISGLTTYTNREVTIEPSGVKPSYTNDSFVYKLYNNDGVTPCDQSWYSVTDDGKCKLNIKNAGTYVLETYTVSKGNCLYRDLHKTCSITVNEVSNIDKVGLYETNDDSTLDESKPLNSLTINRSGSSSDVSKYDISNNIYFADKDGNPPSGDYIDYEIADTTIATVDEKGIITALKAGTTSITISSHNSPSIRKTIDLEVIQLADSIKINTPLIELPQGHSIQLTTTLTPLDATEDISWSSSSDAIIIDENGYITANPDYTLNGTSEDVTIKAQGASSGKSATTIIKVMPANRASSVAIDANTTSTSYDGFYEVDGETLSYSQDGFTLKGTGYDENDNISSDVLVWRVKYEIYNDLVDFSSNDYLGTYYNYQYSTANDTYTITPMIEGRYTFYCIAVERGHENDEFTLENLSQYTYDEFEVRIVGKITSIKNGSISVPTNTEGSITLSISGNDQYDPITVTSRQPLVADASYDEITKKLIVSAGSSITASALPMIDIVSRSGAKATISVKVSNDINDAEVILTDSDEYTYNGSAFKPEFTVFFGGRQITTGYSVSYVDNTNAGTAKIVLTGTGDFVNSQKEIEFTIHPKVIDLKEDTDDEEYNTTAKVNASYYQISQSNPNPLPVLTVTDTQRNKALVADKDYSVTALNNDRFGEATAIVTGIGNYEGSFEINYNVRDDLLADYVEIEEIPDQKYTGSAISPVITIKYYGEVLDSKYYSVKYANNTNKGTATATITGVSPYFTGSKTLEFEIVPVVIESEETASRVEITAQSNAQYGFNEKNGVKTAYVSDTYTLNAVGYDDNNKTVECEYKWYFSCDNSKKQEIEIPEPVKNNITSSTAFVLNGTTYFSFVYNYNSESFTITPDKNLSDQYVFTFYCEAVSDGTIVESNESIIMIPKATMTFSATTTTTIPTMGKVYAVIKYSSSLGYEYSDVEFSTSDPTKATVEKDPDFANNQTVIITANQDRNTMKTGVVTITAKSWDNQVKTINVTVKYNIDDAIVTGGVQNTYDYTGAAVKPVPELVYDNSTYQRTLVSGTDYTISSYKNNTNSGTATIVITGKGEFTGTKEITFNINTKNVSYGDITVTNSKEYYVISDKVPAPVPSLTVKDTARGVTLKANSDYTVTCINNTVSGVATAIVTGIGNYSGTFVIDYIVCDSIKKAYVVSIADQIYSGVAKNPAVTLYYNGAVVDPSNYTVAYTNNINVGTATVTITGKTPFFNDKTSATFVIKELTKSKISKLTTKKKQMTVKWSKVSIANGYQIQYSTDKKFKKGNKTVTVKKNSTTAKTIKKLKSKKKYYVRIRTYKTVDGKKIYSKWSAIKSIKIK